MQRIVSIPHRRRNGYRKARAYTRFSTQLEARNARAALALPTGYTKIPKLDERGARHWKLQHWCPNRLGLREIVLVKPLKRDEVTSGGRLGIGVDLASVPRRSVAVGVKAS